MAAAARARARIASYDRYRARRVWLLLSISILARSGVTFVPAYAAAK